MIILNNSKKSAAAVSITALFLFIMIFPAFPSTPRRIIIDSFERYNNNFFRIWLLRNDTVENAEKIYKIRSENENKYLHAETAGGSIQIAKNVSWDIRTYPILSWKWRVLELPEKADEEAKGKNDSAAAIYVVFQRKQIPILSWKYQPVNVIKYVWSTSLPVGRVVKKKKEKLETAIYEGRFVVLRSGKEDTGRWISERRNVLEDYIKMFGENPRYNPILIAILTDSNDTKSRASADYDDIIKEMISK